jgi:hypothetical protein
LDLLKLRWILTKFSLLSYKTLYNSMPHGCILARSEI